VRTFITSLLALFLCDIFAAPGVITTVAGSGERGFSGDGGLATEAKFDFPNGVVFDRSGHLFIADVNNHRVRRVDAVTGIITTVAGSGRQGFSGDGGLASEAQLSYPNGVVFDRSGHLYISDSENHRVRRVDAATGIITTIAGNGKAGFGGDGGLATEAKLNYPAGLAFNSAGHLYIADLSGNCIRKIDGNGIITTVAGTGEAGFGGDGGLATEAMLWSPHGIAFDPSDHLYFTDDMNNRLRRVDAATGIITTVAGNGEENYLGFNGDDILATEARLCYPVGVVTDSLGNLFFADYGNFRVRRVDALTGIITTIAGNGEVGFSGDGGLATEAAVGFPAGVVFSPSGHLYFGDNFNHKVRKVEFETGSSIFTHQHQLFAEMRYDSESASLLLRSTKGGQLIVTDLLGNLLLTKAIEAGESRFDLSHLPRGRYFAQCGGAVEVITKGR